VMGAAIQLRRNVKNRQANEYLAEPGALTFEPSPFLVKLSESKSGPSSPNQEY
jgi:hypothetical protein